jgi:F-type H+-transporting ATPase subunit delta
VKDSLVARNYAEALVALAQQEDAVERFGELLDALGGVTETDPTVHAVLMSPRVPKAAKQRMMEQALEGLATPAFVRFLGAVIQRGRQGLFAAMAAAYQDLADRHFNRAHASVVTAHPVDERLAQVVTERLTAAVGKTVVPHFRTDPALLGGITVRIGDQAFDGSVRRRIQVLRGRMLRSPAGGTRP